MPEPDPKWYVKDMAKESVINCKIIQAKIQIQLLTIKQLGWVGNIKSCAIQVQSIPAALMINKFNNNDAKWLID